MRLVAEAVVSAGRERVETLKPGAVGSYTENRAVLCVAAQGGAAVEEPPGGDKRPARPCAIRSTERVENPQSGTGISAVTSGAAGEEECQRHTHRSESEEFRASVA